MLCISGPVTLVDVFSLSNGYRIRFLDENGDRWDLRCNRDTYGAASSLSFGTDVFVCWRTLFNEPNFRMVNYIYPVHDDDPFDKFFVLRSIVTDYLRNYQR